ncbi:MAG TPA: hypothetical protein VGL93_25580 [Streptosporangiaceae bacterium]
MNGRTKLGVAALVVLLIGGLWLVAAPFVVGYQPLSKPWNDTIRNDVIAGASLAGVAFVALAVYVGDLLRELTRRRAAVER